MDRRDYNTKEKEKKVFRIVMGVIWAVIITLLVMELSLEDGRATWEPAEVYPMVNCHVTWTGWTGAGYAGH